MNTLKLNCEATQDIQVAQLLLDYCKDDGIYDEAFVNFVKDWQTKNKITSDGIIGSTGWAKIAAQAPTVSATKNKKSKAAKALQILLNVTADGIFGLKSGNALKNYQSTHGLTADKVCGYNTWGSLLGVERNYNVIIPCEDLKQYASPHGSMIYGPDKSYSTYKSGACGVTSFAIIQRAFGLVPEEETSTQTIQRLGKYAWEHGYRVKGAGTKAGLFKTNGAKYTQTSSSSSIINALLAGKLVILLIGKGYKNGYTGSGRP